MPVASSTLCTSLKATPCLVNHSASVLKPLRLLLTTLVLRLPVRGSSNAQSSLALDTSIPRTFMIHLVSLNLSESCPSHPLALSMQGRHEVRPWIPFSVVTGVERETEGFICAARSGPSGNPQARSVSCGDS